MPATENENPYSCDDCVPRGCLVCNSYSLDDEPGILAKAVEERWKFRINGSDLYILDEQGRDLPCVEWVRD